ncbi:MAG: DNA mismatch repair protein MutS [Bacteroidaceae bacterium]|nr:DNA mismatch repair protein MutS [Bacteroidaceae bacterium]
MNLTTFYTSKSTSLQSEITLLRRRTRSYVIIELATFVLAAVLLLIFWIGGYALQDGWGLLAAALLAVLVYLAVRSRDVRSSARLEECEALLEVYEGELAALEGDFSHFDDGRCYVDAHHPYSTDLDLFGPESLFHRMNRTVTTGGSDHLAARLAETSVPAVEEITKRKEDIRELAAQEELRTSFIAQRKQGSVDTGAVLQSLQQVEDITIPAVAASAWTLAIAILLLLVFYSLLLATLLGLVSAGLLLSWALLEVLFAALCCSKALQQTKHATEGIHKSLKTYHQLMRLTPGLQEVSPALHSLGQIIASIDRRNEFWVLFSNALFLSDLFIVRRFLQWRRRYLTQIPRWIEAVSRFDALVSLATFCYNHPEATEAEMATGEDIVFEARQLWHPFLGARAVRNDFSLTDSHYYLITGANMAGKSTFLRAVGINCLLARCGLPVFAEHLRLSAFALFTSMRTTDDLQHGISYFNAELLRLEQLLTAVHETSARTLIILDEILRGTNSLDKLNGSRLFLETIASQPVTGIIATHDLELSRMASEHPKRFHNYCFEIQLSDSVTYSYHITPGVARNQNATYLLQKVLESIYSSKND